MFVATATPLCLRCRSCPVRSACGRNPAVPTISVAASGLGCRPVCAWIIPMHACCCYTACLLAWCGRDGRCDLRDDDGGDGGDGEAKSCARVDAATRYKWQRRAQARPGIGGRAGSRLERTIAESRAGRGIIQLDRQHRAVPFALTPPFRSHPSGLVALRAWGTSRPSIRISRNRRSPYTPPTQRTHQHLIFPFSPPFRFIHIPMVY